MAKPSWKRARPRWILLWCWKANFISGAWAIRMLLCLCVPQGKRQVCCHFPPDENRSRGRGTAVGFTRLAAMPATELRELVYRAPELAQKLVGEMTDRTRSPRKRKSAPERCWRWESWRRDWRTS